ncbi:MAG: hypothetical protein L6Q75_05540 [Burkholderiaceae bacterium]|nr:hypothetical protein [Burkholderiaceae bacterium]
MRPSAGWTHRLRVIREDGLTTVLGRLLRQALRPVWRREQLIFFANDLRPTPSDLPDIWEAFRFTVVGAAGIAPFRRQLVEHFGLCREVIDRRIAEGKEVALALHGQQVVAMVWLAFESQSVDEIGMRLRLLPGEFLTYDAVTLRPWRGRDLSRALNLLSDAYALEQGYSRHLAWRSANNPAALRVAQKLGQERIAVATSTWLFGRMRHRRVASLDPRGKDTVSCLMDLDS